jgi:uncharacterized protein YbjT (DUF2867 family)
MAKKTIPTPSVSVVMLGASGAVGTAVLQNLLGTRLCRQLTLLGRRKLPGIPSTKARQAVVDVFDPASYQHLLAGHDAAICTFGVGESSKVSQEEFVRVDKTAVIAFAIACKAAGVRHFELLNAVAANAHSASFYLRVKGELNDALKALNFERLSLFQPSMILTPTNRYGLMQGLTLAVWPKLKPLLAGPLHKYRGIEVEKLGAAMANNVFTSGTGVEVLHWDEFVALARLPNAQSGESVH